MDMTYTCSHWFDDSMQTWREEKSIHKKLNYKCDLLIILISSPS